MYNAISKYGTMIVQLGLTMILSRLIIPEAYGIVAIITVLIGFFNLFADMGLGINIIQHPEMEKDDINRLFTFSIIVGFALATLTYLSSFPLVAVYDNPEYYNLCLLVSFASFFNAINVVPNAILTRDKRFSIIALRTILCAITSGLIAVVLALLNFGVYALISQSIISALFLFIWNYNQNPLKLKSYNRKAIFKLLGTYSLYQVFFNIINYFTRNLDNLVIGKQFGSAYLAFYNKSYYLYLYPNNIFASVITGVLHPYIREYKNNFKVMYEKYIQIERLLSVIGMFTMLIFFTCSTEIIVIMFGKNWEPAGLCLKGLSICMWSQMMSSVSGSIFLGIERTDQVFKCGIINFCLIVISIIIGVVFNSIYVLSFAIGVAYNLIFIITNYVLIKKSLKLPLWALYKHILTDGIFVFAVCLASIRLPLFSETIIINLMTKASLSVLVILLYLIASKKYQLFMPYIDQIKRRT